MAAGPTDMINCKIINKTSTPLALNWVPGGISIPVGAAAVLSYDPFSLMDRHSSVYSGAVAILDAGLVEIQYCALPPAKTVESLMAPPKQETKVEQKAEPPKQRKSVFETDEEKGSAMELDVRVAEAKAVKKNDIDAVAVSVPKEAQKAEAAEEAPAAEAVEPVNTAEVADAEAKPAKKRSKKI